MRFSPILVSAALFLVVGRASAAAPAESVRFRSGINFGGGYTFGDAGEGLNIGGGLRLGAQFNRYIATYLQTGGTALVTKSTVIAFVPISPMLSITPVDQIEIAAGPSIDYQGGLASPTNNLLNVQGSKGFVFGIAGRFAFHLNGRDESGKRSGLTLGLDIHPLFVDGTTVVPVTLGLGADFY